MQSLSLYPSTVLLDVDVWNVNRNGPGWADAPDLCYCFLGGACAAGPGAREVSRSRGFSTVTVEIVQ